MNITETIAKDGPIQSGEKGPVVAGIQALLNAGGYRISFDGDFGPGTKRAVQRFQMQHGLKPDGIVGMETAKALEMPHDEIVATAVPQINPQTGFPHDDTASLIAYYGDPRGDLAAWQEANLVTITPPWQMFYRGDDGVKRVVNTFQFHRKATPALNLALKEIWEHYGHDQRAIQIAHVADYSGAGNFRPIRGSSRLSCHAFWAAIDFDGEGLPLGHPNPPPPAGIPDTVVHDFVAANLFWGGNYIGRKDPMHFQCAHE